MRSPTLDALEPLKERVLACLEAGATAAGCTMELRVERPGLRRHASTTTVLVDRYVANAGRARPHGRRARRDRTAVVGSTDMGNVSYLVPSIHPMIKVAPPRRVDPHRRSSRATPAADEGDRAVLDGAKALA